MNIIEFQKKLGELLSIAKSNGNKLSAEQVEQHLRDLLLSDEQMGRVYEYLDAEKVTVAGRNRNSSKISEPGDAAGKSAVDKALKPAPLDEQEKRYLSNYRETLEQLPGITEEGLKSALRACVSGNEEACQRVIEAYMPKVVDAALELHFGDVFLGDAIAEGNLSLLSAVRELTEDGDAEARIMSAVRAGIRRLSDEQNEQKRRDEAIVEKVQSLEEKIREITEDGELEFSVDELAVFLDMSRQEIEDVLRLTGEKENK